MSLSCTSLSLLLLLALVNYEDELIVAVMDITEKYKDINVK